MSIKPVREFHCDWSRWTFGAEFVVGNYHRPWRRMEVYVTVFVGPITVTLGAGSDR